MTQRILLIDDTPEQLTVIGTLLENAKMSVITTQSAEEGLKLLETEQVDCVVCDIFMPGMNGGEFVSRLRENKRLENLPVIMLTSSTEDLEMDMLISGADMFCEKANAKKNLLKQIRLLLR